VNIQLQLDIVTKNIQLQLDNTATNIQLQLDNTTTESPAPTRWFDQDIPSPTRNLNNRTIPEPTKIPTNNVRVHAAHDREHGCYNSFTLYRGCTHSPWVVIPSPVSRWLHIHFAMRTRHIHTSFGVRPGDHYKTFEWFHLACNIATEVSPPVWASHPPKSSLLCLIGSSHRSFTHTLPRFCHLNFPAQPVGMPRLDSTTYYTMSYPYRLMVVLFSWVVTPWTGP
jgi:hypothetical protein